MDKYHGLTEGEMAEIGYSLLKKMIMERRLNMLNKENVEEMSGKIGAPYRKLLKLSRGIANEILDEQLGDEQLSNEQHQG